MLTLITPTDAANLALVDAILDADLDVTLNGDDFEVWTEDGDAALIGFYGGEYVVTIFTYRANRETWWNDEHETSHATAAAAVDYARTFTRYQD